MAPLLGRAIDVAVEGGHHQRLLDAVLKGLGGFLDENRDTFRERLTEESPWWVPEPIDDRIFNKIFTRRAALPRRRRAPIPTTRCARRSRRGCALLAERLRDDPEMLAKGEELKDELLAHPEVQAWLQSLWGELKRAMLDAPPTTRTASCAGASGDGLQRPGERLADRRRAAGEGRRLGRAGVAYVVENYRGEVGDLIATTVERWDSADTARRIELQVGRDLQFIRINGTVVGGLAGLLIHAVSEALF